ncbi:MAG: leucine-rich repeat domain-containing protein [Planctomycetota bacterium]|nr:leucine-rich repeat domain-containing protein [Planctomycetota bacterium]
MAYLRLAIVPGMMVLHLGLLCAMVLVSQTRTWDTNIEFLWVGTAFCIVLSQFFLTALWAGLGPEPWPLRISSCGALAVVIWIAFLVFILGPDKHRLKDTQLIELTLGPLLAWMILAGLLLVLRATPWLHCRIAIHHRSSGTDMEDERSDSLTRGLMLLIITCSGVAALLQDSLPWWVLDVTTPAQVYALKNSCVIAAATGIVLLLIALLGIGLTLTPLADWLFYRRRWALPLLVSVGLGGAIGAALSSSRLMGAEIALAALLLVLMLVAQPGTTLLTLGLSGYRLGTYKTKLEATNRAGVSTSRYADRLLALHSFKVKLCRIQLAAPIAVFSMIGVLWPTGVMDRHMIKLTSSPRMNQQGELVELRFRPNSTDRALHKAANFIQLQTLRLNSTRIKDAGLIRLKELTKLQHLDLSATQISDAGLIHLKELANLKKLSLNDTKVTAAGIAELQRALPNCKINK